MNAIIVRDPPKLAMTIVNDLSADVENWFQVGGPRIAQRKSRPLPIANRIGQVCARGRG